jgi:WD40 repeat protein
MVKKILLTLILLSARVIVSQRRDLPSISLKGDTGRICRGIFSPDGTKIITHGYASRDPFCYYLFAKKRSMKIWQVKSGKLLGIIKPEDSEELWKVTFSPDGKYLLTYSSLECDKTRSRILNAKTGKLLHIFEGYAEFSPDSTKIITYADSIFQDATPKVWDLETGSLLYCLETPKPGFKMKSAKFSPNGKKIVTACDGAVRIWDAKNGHHIRNLKGTHYSCYAKFSPDGTKVVTISRSRIARIWDAATGKLLFEQDAGDIIWSVKFAPNSAKILIASTQDVKFFDIVTQKELLTLETNKCRVHFADFSPNGRYVLVTSEQPAKVYDAVTGELIHILDIYTDRKKRRFTGLAKFSPDSTKIFTAFEAWGDMHNNKYVATIWNFDPQKKSIVFSS